MIDPTLFFFFLHKVFTITWVVVVKFVSDSNFYWKWKEVKLVPLGITFLKMIIFGGHIFTP
jgi:hypothetical protein